jgi:4-amino-4-deoxy-L-arabinose transferase-like glycosyltransferase
MTRTVDTKQMTQEISDSTQMIYWVIAAGVAIRAVAAICACVINPDGMVYIQQAKAIYFGEWSLLKSCMPFVSSYPFLIAAAYWVFPSWIDSARLVSVFFGSLTLVPLYFLLRCFTDHRTSCVVVLLYAFMPVLVGGSAELIRDPVCWFFLVSGLYFFVRQLENRETFQMRFFCLLSSYCLFLMACWARPEIFLVLIFSCLYTFLYSLFSKQKKYLFIAVSSLLLFGLLLTAGVMIFDPSFSSYSEKASGMLPASLEEYRNVKQQLSSLAKQLDEGALRSFLFKAGSFAWLVDLGVLVGSTVAGVFYSFIPFFILGLFGLPARLRKDPRVLYLFILVLLGYVLLFVRVLQSWYMEHRFLYIIIFAGCILAAFGIEKTIYFIRSRVTWKVSIVIILISLYIVAFGLGKNIKKREEDKVVFRQIAEYLSDLEKPGHGFVPVLTRGSSLLKLVPFYLNLDLPQGFCPLDIAPVIKNNGELFRYVEERKVKYFLWDEPNWSKTGIDIHSDDFRRIFKELRQWKEKQSGNIILFSRS